MTRKILITGGRGMFATDCARVAAARGHEVIALGHAELDVTRADRVRAAFDALHPDVVVHTVGLAVDPCETHPEEGHRVHVWGTAVVARHCQRIGATLVNMSTCGLFGDERRFYSEYDPPVLKTHYARSKFLAEAAALAHCERVFNVRPGWLFGGTRNHKKNFVWQRYLEAQRMSVLRSAGDKFGSPSHTGDLAAVICDLIDTGEYGLYHVTNDGGCSRYEYVRAIVAAFGLSTRVEMVDSAAFPRPSPVPACEMLANRNSKFLGFPVPSPWQEAIARYVTALKKEMVC